MPAQSHPTANVRVTPPTSPPPARAAPTMPEGPPKAHDLVLFVSSVEGKPVSRLPLSGSPVIAGPPVLIGAQRIGRGIVYDTSAVVGLTRAEVEEHGDVYERTIREGHLRRRDAKAHDAWRAEQKERQNEKIAEMKQEAAKAATDASAAAKNEGAADAAGPGDLAGGETS